MYMCVRLCVRVVRNAFFFPFLTFMLIHTSPGFEGRHSHPGARVFLYVCGVWRGGLVSHSLVRREIEDRVTGRGWSGVAQLSNRVAV